jgi:hypothetical protein
MRTRDLKDDDTGQLIGVEISNFLITRRGVERVVRRIPGAEVTKSYRSWRWSADDDFVHFTLNGRPFVAWEPYGDSDSYWILAQDAPGGSETDAVRSAFQAYRMWSI